jgi:N-acetylmuramoyl-L-alanine amidase
MAYPLELNPARHYYPTRRGPILGIVLHVTAGAQDLDMVGDDGSAWSTIRYSQATDRPSSYHGIVDSDTIVDTLPDSFTAFGATGYNSRCLHLEIANLDATWVGKPAAWVDATLRNAAAWCRPRVARYGLPARLSSKTQVDAALAAGRPFGFTYHSWLDPARRRDPGKDFPWQQFAGYLTPSIQALKLEDDVPYRDWPQADKDALATDVWAAVHRDPRSEAEGGTGRVFAMRDWVVWANLHAAVAANRPLPAPQPVDVDALAVALRTELSEAQVADLASRLQITVKEQT